MYTSRFLREQQDYDRVVDFQTVGEAVARLSESYNKWFSAILTQDFAEVENDEENSMISTELDDFLSGFKIVQETEE